VWSAVKSLAPQERADLPAQVADRLRALDEGSM
jgi:hypothetical protein